MWIRIRILDLDPGRILLFSSLTFKMPTKNYFCFIFSAYYFITNSRYQGFSYYFCMMIEGSGSGAGAESEAQTHVHTVDPDSDPDPQH
jgi:hypothetical protein